MGAKWRDIISKSKHRNAIVTSSIALLVVAVIMAIATISTIVLKKVDKSSSKIDSEILRSMNYTQITDEDSKIDGSDYVQFSSFFTRDLDGDGNAEKLLGTCRNVNNTDTLYMDLNVLTNGYLKDGKITINSTNFNYSMNMVKDSVLKNNYISKNVKTIELNQVNAGTQKLIIGDVIANIGNDTNKYSKVSSLTLTGTHVSDEGVETPISKTIDITVDWHGTTKASMYTEYQATTFYYNYDELDTTTILFNFRLDELQEELILKENVATVTIPELNGYAPTDVKCINSNIETEYNEETKTLTIKRSSKINENGIITSSLSRSNTYIVSVTYPKEAYDQISSYTTLRVPITGYYTGYNNTNQEFENPHKSNIVNGNITLVFRETPKGEIYNFYVDFVDKKNVTTPDYRYVISKQDILNLYDNYDEENTEEIKNKEYVVRWVAVRGSQGIVPSMIMSETKDEGTTTETGTTYGDKWNSTIMEQYVENTGIYFKNADEFLEDDGTISVFNNDTNELIKTFTKEEWNNYTRENPYKYETPVKHIRVETSKTKLSCSLSVYNVKELEVAKVLENFTKDQVKNVELVYTYLTGICNIEGQDAGTVKDIDYAYYVSEKSNSKIDLRVQELSTQEVLTEQEIYISAMYNQVGDSKWKNGEFLVELPEQLINVEINNISVNNSNVKIVAYDVYENNGKYFIKIITENEKPATYKITINCNMTPDPRAASSNENVKLYSYNQYCNEYYYDAKDIYDVDSDNNTNENVGIASRYLNFLSPTSLITLETISDYNNEGEITIAPNVATVEKDARQATINVAITNNYPNTVTGVQILGKIPFEGNTYILNNKDLGSKFTTTMTNEGIKVPRELEGKAVVYYSEKENPNKDLLDSSNGWTLKEDVQDFSKIKTYLIDLAQYTIQVGNTYTFNYVVKIPENIRYNFASYSDHAVYYELNTEGGNLQLSTEPNKVGVKIVGKYSLDLTKYKKGFEELKVPGAAYLVETAYTEGEENFTTRILTTDSNGKASMNNLYIGVKYTLEELKSPDNYVLNDEIIEFKVEEDEQGNLYLDTTSDKITLDGQSKKIYIRTEDEPKYNITITKTDSKTGEPLSDIYFKLNDKIYVTDTNGKVTTGTLILNTEYTLKEVKAEEYYILDGITFKLIQNEDGSLQFESNSDVFRNAIIQNNADEDLIKVNISLDNEKIPTYDLQILKVEENLNEDDITKLKPLSEAKFNLEFIDLSTEKVFTTDENGNIDVGSLYQYVEGKYITGKYVLQEIQAPNGYANKAEKIQFRVVKNAEDKLEVQIENRDDVTSVKNVQIQDNTIKMIIQDKPLFKLVKTDSETGEPLADAQFVIFEIDSNNSDIDYAKDINGNYVGNKDESGQYVVTTDETGTITMPLRGGTYRITEVGYPEGYEENGTEEYFKVAGGNNDSDEEEDGSEEETEGQQVVEINYIEDLVDLSIAVNAGNSYSGTLVKLMKTLDFYDDASYRDANNNTTYADYNGDGIVEGIKSELIDKVDGCGFKQIGLSSSKAFSGIFDGQENEIRNLFIQGRDEYVGLFGYIAHAEIKNLKITGEVNSSVDSSDYPTGGIVGNASDTNIINCCNATKINFKSTNAAYSYVGGIVGFAENTNIINCYNTGKITIDNSRGRLAFCRRNSRSYYGCQYN